MRALDIRILRGFIATAKQHVERLARWIVIDALPRTKINAWLAQAFANRPDIARIAICQPVNARLNLRASLRILQSFEPPIKCVRALNFEHEAVYTIGDSV